jgi:uncharacterized membrane protein
MRSQVERARMAASSGGTVVAYYLKLYLAALLAFLAIDMLWLGVVARGFYRNNLGFIMAPDVNWAAALIFYLLFVFGLLYFAVVPGLQANSLGVALQRAALFGFIAYATYDLTNLATVEGWPVLITVVDMLWGAVLSVVVGYVSFLVGNWMR